MRGKTAAVQPVMQVRARYPKCCRHRFHGEPSRLSDRASKVCFFERLFSKASFRISFSSVLRPSWRSSSRMRVAISPTVLLPVTPLSSSHGDASPCEHELSPTIQKIWGQTIATRNGGNALPVIHALFHDPQLLGRGPATTATAVGDDCNLTHEHMLKAILKPPWSGQGVRSK